MKKVLICLFGFALIFVTACSDENTDDGDGSPKKPEMRGTFEMRINSGGDATMTTIQVEIDNQTNAAFLDAYWSVLLVRDVPVLWQTPLADSTVAWDEEEYGAFDHLWHDTVVFFGVPYNPDDWMLYEFVYKNYIIDLDTIVAFFPTYFQSTCRGSDCGISRCWGPECSEE